MITVVNKTTKTAPASIDDVDVAVYFYDVDNDAFHAGMHDNVTHVVKVDAGLTAQELDEIFDDVFLDYLIENGSVGNKA